MKSSMGFVAAALLALAGCSNDNCKSACDKLSACGLTSSGFSCDGTCAEPMASCAACINDQACGDILPICGSQGTNLPCGGSKIEPK